jgi:hypothetical protein
MLRTNSLSYRALRHCPRLWPIGAPRIHHHPFWCDVRDTPWVSAMRRQVATAARPSDCPCKRGAWLFSKHRIERDLGYTRQRLG